MKKKTSDLKIVAIIRIALFALNYFTFRCFGAFDDVDDWLAVDTELEFDGGAPKKSNVDDDVCDLFDC